MSQLFVVTRPSLLSGFHLAGVDAYSAEDVETAKKLIIKWIDAEEEGLLAIDDGLLSQMDDTFIKLMDASNNLPYLAIPGGEPLGPETSQRYRISAMIRRAIGFHITFI